MISNACSPRLKAFSSACPSSAGNAQLRAIPARRHDHPAMMCQASSRDAVQGQVSQTARLASYLAAGVAAASILASSAMARVEGVNRPDLLPEGDVTTVIDVAGFLAPSEEARAKRVIESLEKDTGYRLRLLAQSYPETPGLAVKDYWAVDANTVVFVADPTFANILNFNVGGNLDLDVPPSYWTRLASKYGNKFFWQEKGESKSIMNAVSAINECLREEPGRFKCAQVAEIDDME